MTDSAFVSVEVEPGAAAPDGISLRFKVAGRPRPVVGLAYEADDGLAGVWRVAAVDRDDDEDLGRPATAVEVEDSSEGTSCLLVGGAAGLVLEHAATGARRREPYLLLAVGTEMQPG